MPTLKLFARSGLRRWVLLVGYSIFLFLLFTLPGDQIPSMVLAANDKLLHFLDFLILALLAFRAFFYSGLSLWSSRAGEKAAGFSILYSGFLEGIQTQIPGRDASIADWIADALGAFAALFVFWLAHSKDRIPPRESQP